MVRFSKTPYELLDSNYLQSLKAGRKRREREREREKEREREREALARDDLLSLHLLGFFEYGIIQNNIMFGSVHRSCYKCFR